MQFRLSELHLVCMSCAHSVAGGLTWPVFREETPIVISSILDGLRMREAYFNAKRTRAGARAWSDLVDKLAGLFLWSDGGLIAKDRSLRVLCMQVLAVCEASLASMFSKVRGWVLGVEGRRICAWGFLKVGAVNIPNRSR